MKFFEIIQNDIVSDFLGLCKEILDLNDLPSFELINNQSCIDGGEKKSFGSFDGQTIRVIAKDRHPIDVMRTLAHELVHWKQNQMGQVMDGSDGSDIENEANAIAGIIMRQFGEKYPNYFINIM